MRRWLVAATLSLASLPGAGLSQTISGNVLFEACSVREGPLSLFCAGYIVGAWEGIHLGVYTTIIAARMDQPSIDDANYFISTLLMSCPPPNVENSQIRDVVFKYLSERPEIRHESARVLIHQSMIEAFPCEETPEAPSTR